MTKIEVQKVEGRFPYALVIVYRFSAGKGCSLFDYFRTKREAETYKKKLKALYKCFKAFKGKKRLCLNSGHKTIEFFDY